MIFTIIFLLIILLFAGTIFIFTLAGYIAKHISTISPQYAYIFAVIYISLVTGITLKYILGSTTPKTYSLKKSKIDKMESIGAWLIALPEPIGDIIGGVLVAVARIIREIKTLKEKLLSIILMILYR